MQEEDALNQADLDVGIEPGGADDLERFVFYGGDQKSTGEMYESGGREGCAIGEVEIWWMLVVELARAGDLL